MGNIHGRKSTSEFNRKEYRKSWRAQRRKQFKKVRNAVRAAAPVPLLGPNTDMFVILAKNGPVRRTALYELFSEMRVGSLPRADKAGISITWKLPGSDTRGQRGCALALDPQFPLYREVRAVLRALGTTFPFAADEDCTPAERVIPKAKRRHDIDQVFYSKNCASVLAALETLRGSATVTDLTSAVPGMREAVAEAALRHLIRDGILCKVGTRVQYVNAPWTRAYRRLVRAYLQSRPDLASAVKAQRTHKRSLRKNSVAVRLLGRGGTERALNALAAHGPLTTTELEHQATIRASRTTLEDLIEAGIVARVWVEKKPHERNGHYLYGLNSAHPNYKAIRNFLGKVASLRPSKKPPLRVPQEKFSLKGLFMTSLRLDVLVSVAIALHGEIDGTSIGNLVPQHDGRLIRRRLKEWADEGILLRRGSRNLLYYRFNPDHPYAAPLQTLLGEIGKTWSDYDGHPDIETELYVERRRTREGRLNRPKRKGRNA
jgi:hypothetical protein